MFNGMNPAKMQGMMKKMGIAQNQLPVKRVIFEMEDSNLIIEEPSVTKVSMQGQVSYQIVGEAVEESTESFSDEDVEMVVEKSGKGGMRLRRLWQRVMGILLRRLCHLKSSVIIIIKSFCVFVLWIIKCRRQLF